MRAERCELMTVIDSAGQLLGARWQTTGGCSKTFAVESEHLGLAVACPHWQSPVRSFRWVVLPELARRSVRQSPVRSFRWVVFARTCPKIRSAHPSSHPLSLILPSDGWFLPELARNSFCSSFIPHPSSFLPTGGSCPNLPEIRSAHPSSLIPHPSFRRVVLPELARIRSAHPSSLILPSDGWFLPELARKSVCQSPVRPFRWVVFARTCSEVGLLILHRLYPSSFLPMGGFCPNLPGNSFCSSFILHPSSLIPHPSSFLPTGGSCPNLPEIRSAKRRLILASSQPRIWARAERRNRRSTPCEDGSARRAVLSFQKSP